MSTLIGAKITSYQPPLTAIGNNFANLKAPISLPEMPVFSSQLDYVEARKDNTNFILILSCVVVAGVLIYYAYQYNEDQKRVI